MIHEPFTTRDHTEIALVEAGAGMRRRDERIEVDGGSRLRGREIRIPGDLSSAAFLIAAALALPDSELRLTAVGVNPTRSDYLRLLEQLGASIALESTRTEGGEAVADIVVAAAPLAPIDVPPAATPGLIDELPVLAALFLSYGIARITATL